MAAKPQTLAALRARIAVLQADPIRNAGPSRAERVADIESFLRGAAAAGDQRMAHHVAMDNPAEVFMARDRTPDGAVNVAAMLAALLGPEALAAILCRHLPEGGDGPTGAERAERILELDRELIEAERAEERLIEASESAGVPIARRADADPRAVLGMHAQSDDAAPPPVFATAPHAAPVMPGVAQSQYLTRTRA